MTAPNRNALLELNVLKGLAEGRLFHRNRGTCPDEIEGPASRDPDCAVCTALIALATPADQQGVEGDYAAGIAFIVRNKQELLSLCAGPTEAFVVEQTIDALAAPSPAPNAGDGGGSGGGVRSILPPPFALYVGTHEDEHGKVTAMVEMFGNAGGLKQPLYSESQMLVALAATPPAPGAGVGPVLWVNRDDLENQQFVGINAVRINHEQYGKHYTVPLYAQPASVRVDADAVSRALAAWYGPEDPGPHTEAWQVEHMRAALTAALGERHERG